MNSVSTAIWSSKGYRSLANCDNAITYCDSEVIFTDPGWTQSDRETITDHAKQLRLGVSKRSLQRALQSEGVSFQSILDTTRSELSLHYLSKDELSVEEISYLLAYRDPNSFYRAFHGWTGITPAQARGQILH